MEQIFNGNIVLQATAETAPEILIAHFQKITPYLAAKGINIKLPTDFHLSYSETEKTTSVDYTLKYESKEKIDNIEDFLFDFD